MEEKESTISGSLGNSDTDSPPPVTSLHPAPPHHHNHHQPAVPSNDVFDGAVVERSMVPCVGGAGGDYLVKKKRGRPRKYDSDGNLRVKPFHQHNNGSNNSVLSSATSPPQRQQQQPTTTMFSFSPSSPLPTDQHHYQQQRSYPPAKRGRGRSGGSGNWQLLASLGELFANTARGDFTPHVVTVNTGEDVGGKILSLSQKGSKGICVLSANGTVSNVTIRQPGSAGGILTYEGRFEILSLTGSFTVSENGGKSRTGGLSVSLASSDGRVIGGGVAGLLLAATPIQMVVGTFMPNGYKVQKRKYTHRDQQHYSLPQQATSQTAAAPQQAAAAKSEAAPASSLQGRSQVTAAAGQAAGNYNVNDGRQLSFHGNNNNSNNSHQNCNNNRDHRDCGWIDGATVVMNSGIHRPSPDINVSVASDEDVPGMF